MFQERDRFAHGTARTKVGAQFVEGTTKACSRFNGSKAVHGIIPLFDATMVLLKPMIEIFTRSMLDITAHCFAYGSWIGSVTIRRYLIGYGANHSNCLLEKRLSCFHISLLTQQGINQIAIVVDRSIQIAPLPMNFDVGLINVPGFSGLPLPLDA